MVIQLDKDKKDAVLSLCQTDILAKLQTLTGDIVAKTGASWVDAKINFSWLD